MKAAVCALAFGLGGSAALAAPADNLHDLFAQLDACMTMPAGTPASEITLVFSLRRNGSLIAKPHISFSRLPASAEQKSAALEAVAQAFDRCLPAQITDGLGGAIAGRPIAYRWVINGGPERGV